MENLAVITAFYHSGSFRTICQVLEKNKNVIHQPRSIRIGKNCPLWLVYRLCTQFFPVRTSCLVNNIMYVKYSLLLNYSSNSPFQGGVTADQERETRAVYQPKRCQSSKITTCVISLLPPACELLQSKSRLAVSCARAVMFIRHGYVYHEILSSRKEDLTTNRAEMGNIAAKSREIWKVQNKCSVSTLHPQFFGYLL